MKRMHVVLVLLAVTFFAGALVSSAQAQGLPKAGLTIKGGLDVMGNLELELDGESTDGDMKTGINLGAEYIFPLSDMIGIGPGAAYMLPRGVDEDDAVDGKLSFLPVYGVLNICLKSGGEITPFIVGQIGYSFGFMDSTMKDDLESGIEEEIGEEVALEMEGGLYWGIGGGILLSNNIQIELVYNVNNGKITSDDVDGEIDVEYSKITVTVGYKF